MGKPEMFPNKHSNKHSKVKLSRQELLLQWTPTIGKS